MYTHELKIQSATNHLLTDEQLDLIQNDIWRLIDHKSLFVRTRQNEGFLVITTNSVPQEHLYQVAEAYCEGRYMISKQPKQQ